MKTEVERAIRNRIGWKSVGRPSADPPVKRIFLIPSILGCISPFGCVDPLESKHGHVLERTAGGTKGVLENSMKAGAAAARAGDALTGFSSFLSSLSFLSSFSLVLSPSPRVEDTPWDDLGRLSDVKRRARTDAPRDRAELTGLLVPVIGETARPVDPTLPFPRGSAALTAAAR